MPQLTSRQFLRFSKPPSQRAVHRQILRLFKGSKDSPSLYMVPFMSQVFNEDMAVLSAKGRS